MTTMANLDGGLLAQSMDETADLDRHGSARYHRALARLPWTARHHRCVGLLDAAGQVLASADRYDLSASLDGRSIRICGVGLLNESRQGGGRHAAELVARIVDDAEERGLDAALVSSREAFWSLDGFVDLGMRETTVQVTESARRGAPMVLVRGGERSDLPHLATLPPLGSPTCRLRLERSAELIAFTVTRQRLIAGLAPTGRRQVHFQVAEEGMRAVAYVLISSSEEGWRLEECGDHDPTGARVGAILQALIASSPAERRVTITGWLPPGFLPPQLTVTATAPAAPRLWLTLLGDQPATATRLTAADVAFWRGDPPTVT